MVISEQTVDIATLVQETYGSGAIFKNVIPMSVKAARQNVEESAHLHCRKVKYLWHI